MLITIGYGNLAANRKSRAGIPALCQAHDTKSDLLKVWQSEVLYWPDYVKSFGNLKTKLEK